MPLPAQIFGSKQPLNISIITFLTARDEVEFFTLPQGGNKTHTEFAVKFDGKDYPVAGSPDFDSDAQTRIGPDSTIEMNKKAGNVVRILHRVLAKDGKSFAIDVFGAYGNNPPFHNVLVFDKQ